jgi:hypothetical protein
MTVPSLFTGLMPDYFTFPMPAQAPGIEEIGLAA